MNNLLIVLKVIFLSVKCNCRPIKNQLNSADTKLQLTIINICDHSCCLMRHDTFTHLQIYFLYLMDNLNLTSFLSCRFISLLIATSMIGS